MEFKYSWAVPMQSDISVSKYCIVTFDPSINIYIFFISHNAIQDINAVNTNPATQSQAGIPGGHNGAPGSLWGINRLTKVL